jgi:uncharacterized protein YlxW (UPF0749 family)
MKSFSETSPTIYEQLQLSICSFPTILHFSQDKLEDERTVSKNLEEQISASVEDLSSKGETEKEVFDLRRQVKELQCAVADEEDEILRLLIQIEKLCLGNDKKQVSHCISCWSLNIL